MAGWLNYQTLQVIWWVLLGVLLMGFAVMDGFDLGIGILLHRVARTNEERRYVLNVIGPVWEGNQVWLILGAGAIFAAWPPVYALSFSGFYFAMLLVLFGLILRPLGFKYRGKIDSVVWRKSWDIGLFLAGFLPALIFGVAIGNILVGVPFHYDENLRIIYTGTFFDLLNPFSILCGLVSVLMLSMHGGMMLCIKSEGLILQRAKHYTKYTGLLFIILFLFAGYFIVNKIIGYELMGAKIYQKTGAWMDNYYRYPYLLSVPMLAILSAIIGIKLIFLEKYKIAWCCSGLSIMGVIATVGISLFPFMIPSSTYSDQSLTVWNASSSQLTLWIMLVAAIIFVPVIIAYTSWIYYVLRGKNIEKIY